MKKAKAEIIWCQSFLSFHHVSRDKRSVPLQIRMPKDIFGLDELDINVFFISCAINTSLYSNLFVLLQTYCLEEADHTLYKIFFSHTQNRCRRRGSNEAF
jgi:hypothetical protein